MTTEEFSNIVTETINAVEGVLSIKAKEYAYGDRLSNFKRAAALLQSTPEVALKGMLTKHIISVYDMIDSLPSKDPAFDQCGTKKS